MSANFPMEPSEKWACANEKTHLLRSHLTPHLRHHLRKKEKRLGRTCYRMWTFTNRNGERFIFGRFSKKGEEPLIVTVAKHYGGNWIPEPKSVSLVGTQD